MSLCVCACTLRVQGPAAVPALPNPHLLGRRVEGAGCPNSSMVPRVAMGVGAVGVVLVVVVVGAVVPLAAEPPLAEVRVAVAAAAPAVEAAAEPAWMAARGDGCGVKSWGRGRRGGKVTPDTWFGCV